MVAGGGSERVAVCRVGLLWVALIVAMIVGLAGSEPAFAVAPLTLQRTFVVKGEDGEPAGWPKDLDVAPGGTVFVLSGDLGNGGVSSFRPDGTRLAGWSVPVGVNLAVSASDVIVRELGVAQHGFAVFTHSGAAKGDWDAQFGWGEAKELWIPRELCSDGGSGFWVADPENHENGALKHFAVAGGFLGVAMKSDEWPSATNVTLNRDKGELVVLDGSGAAVRVLSGTGSPLREFGEGDDNHAPDYVESGGAVAANSTMIAVQGPDCIRIFHTDGRLWGDVPTADFSPYDFAFGPDGSLYVLTGDSEVRVYGAGAPAAPAPPLATRSTRPAVVIVPGFMGSWNLSALHSPTPGSGTSGPAETTWDPTTSSYGPGMGWRVDPVLHTYDYLITTLKGGGYTVGKDLYFAPYDWRMSCVDSAENYLAPVVKTASDGGKRPVVLMAHSMGGLVSRTYLDSGSSDGVEADLIMMGTPNHGSGFVYWPYEGGRVFPGLEEGLMPADSAEFACWNAIITMVDQYELQTPSRFPGIGGRTGRILGEALDLDAYRAVRKYVPAAGEMMPQYDFLSDEKGFSRRPSASMYHQSHLLATLNSKTSLARQQARADMTVIHGVDEERGTLERIAVTLAARSADDGWADGRPTHTGLRAGASRQVWSASGDGTVLASSARLPGADNQALRGVSHGETAGRPDDDKSAHLRHAKAAMAAVCRQLGLPAPQDPQTGGLRKTAGEVVGAGGLLILDVACPVSVEIIGPDGDPIPETAAPDASPRYFERVEGGGALFMDTGSVDGTYTARLTGLSAGEYHIVARLALESGESTTVALVGSVVPGGVDEVSVHVRRAAGSPGLWIEEAGSGTGGSVPGTGAPSGAGGGGSGNGSSSSDLPIMVLVLGMAGALALVVAQSRRSGGSGGTAEELVEGPFDRLGCYALDVGGSLVPLAAAKAVTVGRHAGCDVVLPDPRVSRIHCRITADGGSVVLEDVGSTSGTFVNGRGVAGAMAVEPGDEIRVGDTLIGLVEQPKEDESR